MNYNLFHNTSCLGDAYSFYYSFKWLKRPLRIPLKLNLSNVSKIKQLPLPIRLSLVCCSLEHMVVKSQTHGFSLAKSTGQSFSEFKLYAACKTQVAAEKNLSRRLRYDLVQLEGNSCSSTSLEKSKVSSTNL